MHILFIDIEGGWGGSSRSLKYFIKNLDPRIFKPVVFLGKDGPAEHEYQRDNIKVDVVGPLPRTTAMLKNNLRALILFILLQFHLPKLLFKLYSTIKKNNISIIHLNHESLFYIGMWCSFLFKVKIVYHVRTMLPDNIWGKIQIFIATKTADHIIYISENERDLWRSLFKGSSAVPHSVIHNIADLFTNYDPCKEFKEISKAFKVISLMTLSQTRGADRLIDIASILKKRRVNNIKIIVCGKADPPAYLEVLEKRIQSEGLMSFFLFLGHQSVPEKFIANSDVVLRPSRDNNPWGRDVIEAFALGKPVIAIGTYAKFIEDGINGYLFSEFNADQIADKIIDMSKKPEDLKKMKEANFQKSNLLFDGKTNANKVMEIYKAVN